MKLHISRIRNSALDLMENGYLSPPIDALTLDQLRDRHEHNVTMMDISATCLDAKFEDIKDYTTAKQMWDKLAQIYSGDVNVKRERAESLRGRFNDMKMKEG